MRISYCNYFDDATIEASSSTTAGPIANTQDQRLSNKWIATAVTAQTVTIDLGVATAITSFAILGHNITSAATVVFNGGTTTAVSSIVETLTHNEGIMLAFDTAQEYRYWELVISDNPVAVEIGRIWLGSYITIDPSSTLNFKVTKKRSDVVIHGRNRQKFASIGIGWRRFELSFPRTEEAMIRLLTQLYDEVGNHSSFIFCNFDTIRDYTLVEPCYVSLDGEMGFVHKERMGFTYSMNMEEEM